MADPFMLRGLITLGLFNDVVDSYLKLLSVDFISILVHSITYPAEDVVRQESAEYLDLAVPSPTHKSLRQRTRTLFNRRLPLPCAEFFLAETVPKNQKFDTAYENLIVCNIELLQLFYEKLGRLRKSLFQLFENYTLLKCKRTCRCRRERLIRKYLNLCQRKDVDRFENTFCDLLNICTDPSLDSALTISLIRTFCNSDSRRIGVFNQVPDAGALEVMILQAMQMRFDFWGLWSGRGVLSPMFDYVPHFMALNRNEYSVVLLSYGFPYTAGCNEYRKRCEYLQNYRFQDENIIQSVDIFVEHAHTDKRKRMMLIMDTFILMHEYWRRNDDGYAIKVLRCLNRVLPLPTVSAFELCMTMLEAVMPHFEPVLMQIAWKYGNSDISEVDIFISMPRRLVHLCRVAIWKVLTDNFAWPDGTRKLPIPVELQRYLELEY